MDGTVLCDMVAVVGGSVVTTVVGAMMTMVSASWWGPKWRIIFLNQETLTAVIVI